jgi:hypothetical protein
MKSNKTRGQVRPTVPEPPPTEPEQYLDAEGVNAYFLRHGLRVPHRNTILNMEKKKRFPRRFHVGGQFSRALWKKAAVESWFAHIADSQPKGWEPPQEKRSR